MIKYTLLPLLLIVINNMPMERPPREAKQPSEVCEKFYNAIDKGDTSNIKHYLKIHPTLEELIPSSFLEACLNGNVKLINFFGSLKHVDRNFGSSYDRWPFNHNISQEAKQALFAVFHAHETHFNENNPQEYLGHAARYRRRALIDHALCLGANINAYSTQGLTALHWTCIKGAPNTMAHVLSRGADPNIPCREKRRSCFRLALRMHETSLKKDEEQMPTAALLPCYFLLMCNHADPTIKDIYKEDIFAWLEKQNLRQDEKELIQEILHLNDPTPKGDIRKKREAVLMKIKEFQEVECLVAFSQKNFKKAGWIGDLLVYQHKNFKKIPNPKRASGVLFKEIYEKYL